MEFQAILHSHTMRTTQNPHALSEMFQVRIPIPQTLLAMTPMHLHEKHLFVFMFSVLTTHTIENPLSSIQTYTSITLWAQKNCLLLAGPCLLTKKGDYRNRRGIIFLVPGCINAEPAVFSLKYEWDCDRWWLTYTTRIFTHIHRSLIFYTHQWI